MPFAADPSSVHAPASPRRRLSPAGAVFAAAASLGLLTAGGLGWELYAFKQSAAEQAKRPIGRRHKGVVMVVGGKPTRSIQERFIELAGGPLAHIVVVPTAHKSADTPDVYRYVEKWKNLGVEQVDLLHTRSHEMANDPKFGEPLEDATGVWIEGGRQTLLSEAYADSLVEKELKDLLDRGGVIGGNSAGAAIMSKVMIESGRDVPKIGAGLDLVPGVIIDQHFLKRNRFKRLRAALHKYPSLLGLGIDEGTAVLIEDKHLSVIGDSYVTVCLPEANPDDERIEILRAGDETNLDALKRNDVRISHALPLESIESSQ